MGNNQNLLIYFDHASFIVKAVMGLLFLLSLTSWMIIFQRGFFIRRTKKAINKFETLFWSGIELSKLFNELKISKEKHKALVPIFQAGFEEFVRSQQPHVISLTHSMEGISRAMRIARSQEVDQLEKHLSFLATVGSSSPYIGLFGTVWGIMSSFQALAGLQQAATISLVAPGISEALLATAMGLFAAIPAVIFYNRYTNEVERLINQYEIFQEEFSQLLHRQFQGKSSYVEK